MKVIYHCYVIHIAELFLFFFTQVRQVESELRHKLFPPNSWMKVSQFNVLTCCPKDELHQWFIGLYGEHIIPAIVYRYTQVLQRPDLITVDKNGKSHPLISNEAVARVFKRLADRLVGAVSDTSMLTITPEYAAHFLEVYVKKTEGATFTGDRIRFIMLTLPMAVRDLIAPEVLTYICHVHNLEICQIYCSHMSYIYVHYDIHMLCRLLLSTTRSIRLLRTPCCTNCHG